MAAASTNDPKIDSNNNHPQIQCTCGPYPIIDLMCPPNEISHQMLTAAETHGCFHILLDNNNNPTDSFPEQDTSDSIRKLFHHRDDDPQFETSIATFRDETGRLIDATYRGRTCESGDPTTTEPKQSWELHRCRCSSRRSSSNSTFNPQLKILHHWIDKLHSIATMISETLRLPPDFIVSESCDDETTTTSPPCNKDLLRVFLYDPLPTDQQHTHLGSSPHTDWGTLTIVWQDSIGGLETYCHHHRTWNPVLPLRSKTSSVFVHVGDFTSLATNGKWPSPYHRVVCSSKKERCSLVYFAYPRRGMTVGEARRRMLGEGEDEGGGIPYEWYSLLRDQSKSSLQKTAEEVYRGMRDVPFDRVVEEKWSQVQRK